MSLKFWFAPLAVCTIDPNTIPLALLLSSEYECLLFRYLAVALSDFRAFYIKKSLVYFRDAASSVRTIRRRVALRSLTLLKFVSLDQTGD